jgi:hypothetical protein
MNFFWTSQSDRQLNFLDLDETFGTNRTIYEHHQLGKFICERKLGKCMHHKLMVGMSSFFPIIFSFYFGVVSP